MNQKQAEDFIYKSYLKAQQYQDYNTRDCEKRRNDLTYDIVRKKSNTPCVVITGSKGKGSVANMISQILQTEYTVGLMTSPHIVDFCERFQVNGGKISAEDFIKYILLIQEEIEKIDASIPKNVCISPMGIQAYLALNYFKDEGTEFNIFECGKGAKYDDVNNIKHDYAVINSIFLEHTRELGESIEEIAQDKAHVIDGEQKYVYVAEQIPEVMKVIQDRADRLEVPLKIYGQDFFAKNICYTKEGMKFDVVLEGAVYSDIVIPLMGEHQAKNCTLAFALCKDVFEELSFKSTAGEIENIDVQNTAREIENVDVQNTAREIENVDVQSTAGEIENMDVQSTTGKIENAELQNEVDKVVNFNLAYKKKQRIEDKKLVKIKEKLLKINWPGRMEVISKHPFILLDACIHGASCNNVIEVLEHLGIEKAVFIIGIPDDKDYVGVAKGIKEMASHIILTKSQNPHYVFTKIQQERLKEEGIYAVWTERISEAIDLAKEKNEYIVILGTTSVIAEVKKEGIKNEHL